MSDDRSRAREVGRKARRRLSRIERVLRRAQIDEYIIVERKQRRVSAAQRGVRSVHSSDQRELEITLFRDLRRGRASANFTVSDDNLSAIDRLAADAAARAGHGLGPEWRLPPPAAPARVDLADSSIIADPEGVALATMEQLLRATTGRTKRSWKPASTSVEVEARETTVLTSSGFVRTKTESFLQLDATLRDSRVSQRIRRRARRRDDLSLESEMARASERMKASALASQLPAGRYDLLLELDAIVGSDTLDATGPARFGWFTSLVAQADAQNQRRGLARYGPGKSVYGTRKVRGDKLTLSSDGTLPFGWYSSPFSDQGEAVRRFTMIKNGVADQLALTLREAALRKTISNGGVRNIVVAAGKTPSAALALPGKRPLIRVGYMAGLDVEPLTGEFGGQLGLSHGLTGNERTPHYGGVLRGNLFDLFANVVFARETGFHTWYSGPKLLRFNDVGVY